MQARSLLQRSAYAAVVSATLMGIGAPAKAQGLPAYMQPIEGRTTTSAAEIANKNVLALNTMMFELYGDAAGIFQRNLLSKHPVILGLFSGAGGRFILYRPDVPPLEAPQVPIVYQLLKSVGHSTMAVSEVVLPFVDNPADLIVAQLDAGLSQPHAVRARRPRCHADTARMARHRPDDIAKQHRVHGRLRSERRHCVRQVGGVRQEAIAQSRAHRLMGRANAGQALDGGHRGLEEDARQRLGEDLRGQQHDLRRPPKTTSCSACSRNSSVRRRSTTG